MCTPALTYVIQNAPIFWLDALLLICTPYYDPYLLDHLHTPKPHLAFASLAGAWVCAQTTATELSLVAA